MRHLLTICAAAVLLTGCLNLDGFVHNPVHCSTVGEETCGEDKEAWDRVCVPCGEDYDWAADYPWFDETLSTGQTVRPIDAATVRRETFTAADGEGELDLYFIPAHGDDAALASTTILYNHGNYAGVEHYLPRLRYLHEGGYSVLVWDYRGYGKSLPDSAPNTDQFFSDSVEIRDFVDSIVPDPDRIVLYANSLGALPAIEMALHDPGCALFLEVPFISMSTTSRENSSLSFSEAFFSEGRFDNIEKIKGVTGPVLAMQGDLDNKFTVDALDELMDGVQGPKETWILEGVRHGISNIGVPEAGLTPYLDTMRSFLDENAPGCL